MKYSAMVYSFCKLLDSKHFEISELLKFISATGFDGVDLDYGYINSVPANVLRQKLQAENLFPACMSVFAPLGIKDETKRKENQDRVLSAAEYSAAIGITNLLIVPGFVEPQERQVSCPRIVDSLGWCVPKIVELGVTPTIEPFPGDRSPFVTGGEVMAVCRAVGPDLKVTFDIANGITGGEDSLATLQAVQSRMVHVHAKNFRVQDRAPCKDETFCRGRDGKWYVGTALDEGMIPVSKVLAVLAQSGYRGYIAWEYEGNDDSRLAARKGLNLLQRYQAE